jgi:hypothetical protein
VDVVRAMVGVDAGDEGCGRCDVRSTVLLDERLFSEQLVGKTENWDRSRFQRNVSVALVRWTG